MKSKHRPTRPKKIPVSLVLAPRLAAYSATAAAALAFAPNAHAQVIPITSFNYSGLTNTTTPPGFTLPAPTGNLIFNAGPFEFYFHGLKIYHSSSGGGGRVFLNGRNSLSIAAMGATALKLAPGVAIKLHTTFNFDGQLAFYNPINKAGYFLPPPNGAATGYIGFKGTNAGHNYYGWLDAQVTGDANGYPDSVALVAKAGDPGVFGAYDISTDPDINTFGAGQVPEPADSAFGLGLLAFGAAGVRELRRRRKAA
jgi:hypothetical protein